MKLPILRTLVPRRAGAMLLAVFLAASAVAPAWAGDRMRARGMMVRQAPFAGRAMRAERPAAARAQQPREQAPQPQVPQPAPVEQRPPEAPQVDRNGRPGRLTPDERRALRQQINDAGRDIYRPPARP